MKSISEQVDDLVAVLPKLKPTDLEFAMSLIASFKKYKGLTPKQAPWVGKLIAKAVPTQQVQAAHIAAPSVNVGDMTGVQALFAKAKAHLKYPKITLQVGHKSVVLSLAGEKSKYPGHIHVAGPGKYPHREFYGRITPTGQWQCSVLTTNETMLAWLEQLRILLVNFAQHPDSIAAVHGQMTGHCCFCGKVLGLGEEKRSVLIGYGPVCATHYGLKDIWDHAASQITPMDLKGIELKTMAKVVPTMSVTPQAMHTIAELAAELEEAKIKKLIVEQTMEDAAKQQAVHAIMEGALQASGATMDDGHTQTFIEQYPATTNGILKMVEDLVNKKDPSDPVWSTVSVPSSDSDMGSWQANQSCFFCGQQAVSLHPDGVALCQECAMTVL